MDTELVFLDIIATLKDLAIAKKKLASLSFSNIPDALCINLDKVIGKELTVSKIETGLYKDFYALTVVFKRSQKKDIVSKLHDNDINLHFIGYTPGWTAKPIYLLWTERRFPRIYQKLSQNKELDKLSKLEHNKDKETI